MEEERKKNSCWEQYRLLIFVSFRVSSTVACGINKRKKKQFETHTKKNRSAKKKERKRYVYTVCVFFFVQSSFRFSLSNSSILSHEHKHTHANKHFVWCSSKQQFLHSHFMISILFFPRLALTSNGEIWYSDVSSIAKIVLSRFQIAIDIFCEQKNYSQPCQLPKFGVVWAWETEEKKWKNKKKKSRSVWHLFRCAIVSA